jgi:hypothetical protein
MCTINAVFIYIPIRGVYITTDSPSTPSCMYHEKIIRKRSVKNVAFVHFLIMMSSS